MLRFPKSKIPNLFQGVKLIWYDFVKYCMEVTTNVDKFTFLDI